MKLEDVKTFILENLDCKNPPFSFVYKVYAALAGEINCMCCVFWRGLIIASVVWYIIFGIILFGVLS